LRVWDNLANCPTITGLQLRTIRLDHFRLSDYHSHLISKLHWLR
jgi:hypothetical protein